MSLGFLRSNDYASSMAEQEIELTCKDCGKTFTTFLKEMAEHNAKVVCPHCGKPIDQSKQVGTHRDASRPE